MSGTTARLVRPGAALTPQQTAAGGTAVAALNGGVLLDAAGNPISAASLGTGIASDGVGSLTLAPTNGEPAITHVLATTGGVGGTLWETSSREYPGTAGYSAQFREGTFPVPFTYKDFVYNYGYNYNGSARVNAAEPAFFWQFEHQYQLNNSPLSSQKVVELHFNVIDAGGTLRRPIDVTAAWDGGFTDIALRGSSFIFADLQSQPRLQGIYITARTTLAVAINNSTTTIELADGASLANGQYFTILAETSNTTETVLITAGGGTNTLTVTRAQLGTAASAHSLNAAVEKPSSQLTLSSSAIVRSDALSPFTVTNIAGTENLLVINRAGSTISSALNVSAFAQNLLILTNRTANGTASLQIRANNGAKTGTWSLDFGGNMIFSANGTGGAMFFDFPTGGAVWRTNGFVTALSISNDSTVGIGLGPFVPTAFLHIKAGTATIPPLKLNSGTNTTTAQNGAFEYNGTNLFFTRASAAREGVLTQSAVTAEALTSDTSVTVNIGGTTYKLLARA